MIVVFGSLNVDMITKVDHLPKPGETVLCPSYIMVPGGKGANQACAAARAASGSGHDSKVAMVGAVGDDSLGPRAVEMLRDAGVDLSALATGEKPTGCALIWVDAAGENSIVVASGSNAEARADMVPDGMLGPDTTMLMQMEIPVEENWALVKRARAAGCRIMLNVAPAAPVPTEVLDAIDVLVVNQIEAEMIAQAGGHAGQSRSATAKALADAHGLTCIVTLGKQGTIAHGPDGGWRVAALPVEAVDTTGAGDGFVGILGQGLDAGLSLPDALVRASVGAALACLTLGCQSSFVDGAAIAARLGDLPAPTQI